MRQIETMEELRGLCANGAFVVVEVDAKVSMARLTVNGRYVTGGNFWDFHPGCHRGITQELDRILPWRGVRGLVESIRSALGGSVPFSVEKRAWQYVG